MAKRNKRGGEGTGVGATVGGGTSSGGGVPGGGGASGGGGGGSIRSAGNASGSGNAGGAGGSGITSITLRTYITAFVVLLALMVTALIMTQVLPAGEFERTVVEGSEVIVPDSYHSTSGDLPIWKWALAPVLILGGANNVTLIMLIVFLFVIGGAFFALESCGVLTYLITSVAHRFKHNNRVLLFVLPLIFMLLGTLIGSFEEVIPLAAIVVALAIRLGWDRYQGLTMSLLAVGCGFAVGVMNPFTVGIAQSLAGLAIFSGAGLRIISFVLVYACLMAFLLIRARRSERTAKALPGLEIGNNRLDGLEETPNPNMSKALRAFVIVFVIGIAAIIACSVVPVSGLSDLVFPVCALTFLLCGVISPLLCGSGARKLGIWFLRGIKALAPAVILVLMASSISFMLSEGRVLDTIIYYAYGFLADKPGWAAILGIYLLVMLLEFAVPSGSAKAFLLIPLIAPLVDLIDISRQLAVVAYAFGDGFTNVLYPTNPALLIALSICGVSYGQWIRRTWPFFLTILVLTSAILVVGLAIGYS